MYKVMVHGDRQDACLQAKVNLNSGQAGCLPTSESKLKRGAGRMPALPVVLDVCFQWCWIRWANDSKI